MAIINERHFNWTIRNYRVPEEISGNSWSALIRGLEWESDFLKCVRKSPPFFRQERLNPVEKTSHVQCRDEFLNIWLPWIIIIITQHKKKLAKLPFLFSVPSDGRNSQKSKEKFSLFCGSRKSEREIKFRISRGCWCRNDVLGFPRAEITTFPLTHF